jgi:hypothetical protein
LQSNFGEKRTGGEGIFSQIEKQFEDNLSRHGREVEVGESTLKPNFSPPFSSFKVG